MISPEISSSIEGLPLEAGKACPFLGLMDDPKTHFAYPTPGNHCFHSTPALMICPSHQAAVCLEPVHIECPVYQENWQGPLPQALCGEVLSSPPWWRQPLAWVGVILTLLVVGGAAIFWWKSDSSPAGAAGPSPVAGGALLAASSTPSFTPALPLPSATFTPLAFTPTASPTLPPSPTVTPTPAPSIPPTATPGPAWGTPFGPQYIYLLHQVKRDESVGLIAALYQTTVEVIVQTNQLPEWRPIQPGDVLVILPGHTTLADITPVRVVQLAEATPLASLAQEYRLSAEEVRRYNSLGSEETIPAGRWLILPFPGG